MRRPTPFVGLVAVLVVLPATAALAHPALNPDQVPAGQPVETTLVVPHGCSTADEVMPEEGSAVPTTRFDLQLVDGVTIEPGDVDGWDVADDGEAIVWTDAGGATTEPLEFPMTLTVTDGSPGDTVLLAAYQECEDGSSYRWTEGSDDTPPVRLELTAGETGTAETATEGTHHGDGGTSDLSEEESEATDRATATPSEDATDAAAAAGDGGVDGATVAAVLAVVVAVAAGIVSLVRRRRTA